MLCNLKSHVINVGMAIIKKSRDRKYWQGCGNKGMQIEAAIMERVQMFLKKLEMKLLYNPPIPHQRIYLSEGNKIISLKICLTSHVCCSIIYNSLVMETT